MDPVPPVISPNPPPEPPPLPEERQISIVVWVRWALISIFFLALTLSTVSEIDSEAADPAAPSSSITLELKMALTVLNMEAGSASKIPPRSGSQGDQVLRAVEAKVSKWADKNDESAALNAFIQKVRHGTVQESLIKRLNRADREEIAVLSSLYGGKKLSEDELDVLKNKTTKLPEIGRFVAVHVQEYEGEKNALREAFPPQNLIGTFGMFGILIGGFLLGVACWVWFLAMRNKPGWTPQGHFFDSVGAEEGSKLGLLGAACVGMFIVIQGVVVVVTRDLDKPVRMILSTLTFLAILFAVLSFIPIGGKPFTKWLNQSDFSVGKQVGIGFLGWAANLPVLALVIGVMSRVIQDTNPSHPATEMIGSGGTLMLVAVFLAATISAPLWEEVVFRGALFGGMRATLKSKPWGLAASVVLTSLAFAAIHPQGPALWIGLGWIGAMGCFLSYYTRSIIASVVMHAMHNGTLVGLSFFLLR